MTLRSFATTLGTIGLLTLLCACAPLQRPMVGNPQLPYPPPRAPQVGDILHVHTGFFVDTEAMLDAALDTRIVYIGEVHDNPASHRLELTVLKAMAQRYPGRTAVAMEMFTPAQQPTLDAWVAGEIDEKTLLKRWYKGWSMDFDYYRDILAFARQERIPVLGINAEKKLVQAVARKEFKDLTAEEQAQLPKTLDMTDPYQLALTETIFGGHDKGGEHLPGFQRVQTLWDETMAENIVRYLDAPQSEDVHLLVLAGGNHVRNGFGIPRRVFRSLPLSYTLIGSQELEVSEAKKEEAYMQVTLPTFASPAYDFLVYNRYEDLEKAPEVKLGVKLEEKDGKVAVVGMLPGSSAEKSGLKDGDILRRLDEEPLTDSFDLVYALKQKQVGGQGRLIVEREGKELTLPLTYEAAPQHGQNAPSK